MKYVRFRRHGEDSFVFTLSPTAHSDLADAMQRGGWVAHSAGFVKFRAGGVVDTCGRSESLGLGPDPLDARMIELLTRATLHLAEPATVSREGREGREVEPPPAPAVCHLCPDCHLRPA